ncbi:unnamed protein product, partial [Discosporangium mesarthrocarpum]
MSEPSWQGDVGVEVEGYKELGACFLELAQICGRGDIVEGLTHLLAQQEVSAVPWDSQRAVNALEYGASLVPGDASASVSSPLQPLSDGDMAKIRGALRCQDGHVLSVSGQPSPPASPSPGQFIASTSNPLEDSSGIVDDVRSVRLDLRVFAQVLRAVLGREGDHVLRRSLLCHPLVKSAKSNPSVMPATGSAGPNRASASG